MGCSYLKRGVNDRGRVANDVETEQIILDEEAGSCKGKMSSVVQMRGSIPLFWSQEASRFSPKPDIICKNIMWCILISLVLNHMLISHTLFTRIIWIDLFLHVSILILVQRYDPTYQATKLHFEDLAKRYGNPIIVLNLIKVYFRMPS